MCGVVTSGVGTSVSLSSDRMRQRADQGARNFSCIHVLKTILLRPFDMLNEQKEAEKIICDDDFTIGAKIAVNPCSRPHQRSERDRKTRSDYGLETEKKRRGEEDGGWTDGRAKHLRSLTVIKPSKNRSRRRGRCRS